MSILQLRIKNCLQTILELQPLMLRAYQRNMAEDFSSLRIYLERADTITLAEEDVERIETMTAEFLREISLSSGRHISGALQ